MVARSHPLRTLRRAAAILHQLHLYTNLVDHQGPSEVPRQYVARIQILSKRPAQQGAQRAVRVAGIAEPPVHQGVGTRKK